MTFLKRVPVLVWVWLLPVALGLPFVGRAYFVDDHYHVLMAQGLLEHPARPYDFRADDAGPANLGWEKGRPPRMVNPPLHHYLLAAFLKLGGGCLWAARLGCLFLSGFGAVFIYLLARWLLFPPLPVTVLCVLTPAFWLSSHSLLIDSTLLTFFAGALWAWVEGLKKRSVVRLGLSGLFMGCALLTKYTGGFVGLLALAWWGMQAPERRRWRDLWPLLIPAAMLAGWSAWNAAAYGAVHVIESSRRVAHGAYLPQVLTTLTFFAGGLLVPLWSWGGGVSRVWPALAGGAGLAAFLASPWGGFSVFQAGLMAFLAAGGLLFLWRTVREAKAFFGPSDGFLVLWLFLGLAQMVLVLGWVAVRYYAVLVPPAVFLFYRLAQARCRHAPSALNRLQAGAGVALFLVGLALGWADHAQAETNRRIARDLLADGWRDRAPRCFYLGDSFTGNDLKAAGWETAFPETAFAPGDLVLLREVVMPPWWFRPAPGRFQVLKAYEYPSRFPLRVMDNRGAAGFYASVWGALPFTFSRGPLERYTLLRVVETPS